MTAAVTLPPARRGTPSSGSTNNLIAVGDRLRLRCRRNGGRRRGVGDSVEVVTFELTGADACDALPQPATASTGRDASARYRSRSPHCEKLAAQPRRRFTGQEDPSGSSESYAAGRSGRLSVSTMKPSASPSTSLVGRVVVPVQTTGRIGLAVVASTGTTTTGRGLPVGHDGTLRFVTVAGVDALPRASSAARCSASQAGAARAPPAKSGCFASPALTASAGMPRWGRGACRADRARQIDQFAVSGRRSHPRARHRAVARLHAGRSPTQSCRPETRARLWPDNRSPSSRR